MAQAASEVHISRVHGAFRAFSMVEVRISRELARTQGGGNPACFSSRSAHYAIEGSRIRHRQKDFLLAPHGILRVPASRGLPALALRARELDSPLDCQMLRSPGMTKGAQDQPSQRR